MKGVSYSQTDSQALTNQLAQGFSRSGSESFKQTWGDSLSQNLSKSASELVSASDTFTTMSQLQNQMGSMTNTDFKTLGGAVAQTPAAMNQLNDYFRNAAPQSVKDEAAKIPSLRNVSSSGPGSSANDSNDQLQKLRTG